jgi:hypothetical protein
MASSKVNDSFSQTALAQEPAFQGRVRSAMSTVAWAVLNEDPSTPNHDKRAAFARTVLSNGTFAAQTAAPWLVERPNVLTAETSYDFHARAITTAATDADLVNQLTTDWDILSGV